MLSKRSLSGLILAAVASSATVARAQSGEDSTPSHTAAEEALARELYESAVIGVDGDGPYQGRDHRRLGWPDFYRIVDRPDLAMSYVDRGYLRSGLGILGGTALGVGVLWGFIDLTATIATGIAATPFCVLGGIAGAGGEGRSTAGHNPACDEPKASGVPWAVALTGAGMLLAIPIVRRTPTSDAESRQLAQAHNDRLRQRTGVTIEASPYLGPGLGGVLVGGRF
jgi:hypothetical protein